MKFQVIRTDGKDNSNNKYLVVNIDEPYAAQVADLIEKEERRKGTWDHGDKTMREVMGINVKCPYCNEIMAPYRGKYFYCDCRVVDFRLKDDGTLVRVMFLIPPEPIEEF